MELKLSIIVPCYNVSEYILDLLYSFYNEANDNVEFILIDDGSTDNTLFVISDFLRKFPIKNAVVFSKKNEGLSVARNFGVSKSNGEFIWFLDGDDALRLGAIEELIHELNTRPDMDIIAFQGYDFEDRKLNINIENYTENNNWLIKSYNRAAVLESDCNSKQYLISTLSNYEFLPTACFYVQRKILLIKYNLKFIPNIYFEDSPYTVNLFVGAHKILILDLRIILRRRRKGSIMRSDFNSKKAQSLLIVAKSHFNAYLKCKEGVVLKLAIDSVYHALRQIRDNKFDIFPYLYKNFVLFLFSALCFVRVRTELIKNIKFSLKVRFAKR